MLEEQPIAKSLSWRVVQTSLVSEEGKSGLPALRSEDGSQISIYKSCGGQLVPRCCDDFVEFVKACDGED